MSKKPILFRAAFEYNHGSEYEYFVAYYIWETTLIKAQKYAEKRAREDGFKWNKEEQAFMNTDPGALDQNLRICVNQELYLTTLNGGIVDLREAQPVEIPY